MFTAVLDSCVLWPSLLRDFLLSPAIEGGYRAIWSSAILAEVERNERRKLIRRGMHEVDADVAACRLISLMRSAFPDAEAEGWEHLVGSFGLPDQNDEHVLAAAVAARADAVVTENLRHFPPARLRGSVSVLTPREFIQRVLDADRSTGRAAVRQIAARSGTNGRPKRSESEVVSALIGRYGLSPALAPLFS